MIWRCDLVPQYQAYKAEIDEAIQQVLMSGRYILAENVTAFEQEFAQYIGVQHGVGVNSGTDALMMALWLCNLQPGDEVITTPFTAIPTFSAIRHVGAKPVFLDLEPDTFLMNLDQLQGALTERTKAIVPVHLFGNAVDVQRIREIVGPDILIVEDCAQSHGAKVRGTMTGAMGDFGAFSFYPTKNLGAYGDGGLVVTNDAKAADIMKKRRMYGMISKDEFVTDGINTRLDELQAAILRVKLRHLDTMNARRRELAAIYAELLPTEHVRPQVVRDGVESVWHVYCATVSGRRDELLQFLESRHIQANVYYPMPMSKQRGYMAAFGADAPHLPVAEYLSHHIIALPFYPEIEIATMQTVAQAICEFYGV
ncbi:MAG: DegT/DnrJ/EryC1/StrS family aminotransferase [Bacteroidota bacterium]|nr:DegT/DnrJ/EryC1/StrS family aminotransferase [Candidatus Kapabacteria bacterium]MDW8220937.1 DegT/DnrJ/EryC1/StrS family aminotransferase [Bacteroidota bacterium]